MHTKLSGNIHCGITDNIHMLVSLEYNAMLSNLSYIVFNIIVLTCPNAIHKRTRASGYISTGNS